MRVAGQVVALLVGATLPWGDRGAGAAERLLEAPGGLAAVRVRVGPAEVEMLVDTGSTGTVIDPALARALALPPVDRVLLTTPTGTRALPRAVVPRLELDGRIVEDLRVIVAELPGLAETGRTLRGILGLDALSGFELALDFVRRELALGVGCPLPGQDTGARVAFEDRHGVVLETRTRPGERPLRLLLDSGASGLVLFGPAAAAAGPDRGAPASAWRITTAEDTRAAPAGRVPRLDLGGLTLEDIPAALVHGASARGVDGLLPASLFSRVCLSRAGGYVLLEPPQSGERPGVALARAGG